MRRFLPIAVLAVTLSAVATTPALADTVTSSNWAGYAVHRPGTTFTNVAAVWTQPKVRCTLGQPTYSAVWVGLGGYNMSSDALEQIGSEADCRASGKVDSTVWYELVPAASQPIRMQVRPGDRMFATVGVIGNKVTLSITNETTHRAFKKTLRASLIDVSSAEWIVEAPSNCISDNSCVTLPLANFGSTSFLAARAQTVAGHIGTISDAGWDASRIRLTSAGRRFIDNNGSTAVESLATPSALTGNGSSFRVSYSTAPTGGNVFATARASTVRAGHLVHPGR